MSRLFTHYETRYPFLIILGIVGAVVALVSLFWFPALSPGAGMSSVPPGPPESYWASLHLSLPSTPFSVMVRLFFLLLPVCIAIALVIGCASLFQSLPRLAVYGYTLALLFGLVVFCVALGSSFVNFNPQWGFLVMGVGYLALLLGRLAFKAG